MADRPTPPERPAAGRVAALDGVRGLAILVVLIHNAAFIMGSSDALILKLTTTITGTGWTGVQLFFVLSGFLITGILLDARGSPTFFRTFYLRRTLRIFPLYYVFLAVAFFVVPLFADHGWTGVARRNQWWYWTYLSNWGGALGYGIPGLSHFWSLAVEEQFYLLWPLLVFALSRRGLTALCAVLIGATPLLRLLLRVSGLPELAGYEFTIARWDALAFGAVLAILVREEAGRAWLRPRAPWIGGAAVLGLVAVMGVERGFPERALLVQVAGQTLAAALGASLIYFSVVPFRPSPSGAAASLRASLSAPWLRFLGKYSYAIYVLHFPIHILVSRHVAGFVNAVDGPARLLRLALYVPSISALSIVAALISWRVIEKPFLDLKERFAPRETS